MSERGDINLIVSSVTAIAGTIIAVVAIFVTLHIWREDRNIKLEVDFQPWINLDGPKPYECAYLTTVRNPMPFDVQITSLAMYSDRTGDAFVFVIRDPALLKKLTKGPPIPARVPAHSSVTWKTPRIDVDSSREHLYAVATEGSTQKEFASPVLLHDYAASSCVRGKSVGND